MTLLEFWVHTPLARSLGLALVHSLWEGVFIAVLLAGALCVARPSRARYGAACVALLLMLASFSVTLAVLLPKPMELARTHAPVLAQAAPAGLPIAPGEALPEPSGLAALLPWMAPFWAAGVLLFHLRALGGWMAARRLRISGVCRAPGEWQERLDALATRLRVSKPTVLLESCLANAPVVMGHMRPVILAPVGLLAGLPVAQVEAILIHELAHIRRQDYLVNLMQTFIEGLLFYHPAVWWISGVIRAERENCCDDLAVAVTGDARQYAAALAALEQNRWAAHELALAATGGSLVKRIRRLLQQPERPSAVWTPIFSAVILVVSAGIALASWQTQPAPAPRPKAPVLVVFPAPAAPVAIELPAARVRRPAPVLLAQVQQTAAPSQSDANARPMTERERKAKEAKAREELATPYKKWLNEDVAYIITDQERSGFKALTTDDERENFIEQFWLSRDPTPGTPENEFKAEHYRRIGYANEHFTTVSSLSGWKSDRGRIYITFGPPDEIEDHSAGGAYVRPAEAGGGTTSTFPFQQWRYRFIDGVGNNVVIEFVDKDKTGDFRMTSDPSDKEALTRAGQPNVAEFQRFAALSQAPRVIATPSADGQAGRGGRGQSSATATQPKTLPAGNMFVSVGDGPKVTISVTAERKMYVSIALPSEAGTYDIIGQTVDAQNRTVNNFRETNNSYLDRPLNVAPGTYTLTIVVRERISGTAQSSTVSFYVN